jgi:hypothetical protein
MSPETGKTDCLVIDVTENILTHFNTYDLDRPNFVVPRAGGKKGEPCLFRYCDNCGEECSNRCVQCPTCGHEFKKESIPAEFLPKMVDVDFDARPPAPPEPWFVQGMSVDVHQSKKKDENGDHKQLMKISFEVTASEQSYDFQTVSEWVCFADYYTGFAVTMGHKKWGELTDEPFPDNVTEGVWVAESAFKRPVQVMCVIDGKYLKISSYVFDGDRMMEKAFVNDYVEAEYDDDIPF